MQTRQETIKIKQETNTGVKTETHRLDKDKGRINRDMTDYIDKVQRDQTD